MPQGRALRNIAAAGLAWLAFAAAPALAQSSCAVPGTDGVATISAYPNTIHPGSGTAAAGTTSVSLGTRNGAGAAVNIAPGDLVLIVQMQDASIDSSNTSSYGGSLPGAGFTSIGASGVYEYGTVSAGSATIGAGGGTLTLSSPLLNTYTTANASGSQGQRRFQVLRVPQNSNLTLSGTISAPSWDGNSGGVIAIEAAGQLNWGGATLDAAGRGFRGGGAQCSTGNSTGVVLSNQDYRTVFGAGTVNLAGVGNVPNSAKGEGVAGTPILVFIPTAPNNGNAAGSVLWACSGGGTTGIACQAQDGSSAGYPNGSFGRGAPGNAGGGATDGDPNPAPGGGNDQNTGGAGGGNYSSGGHGGYGWTPGTPPGFDTGGFGGAPVPGSPSRLFFGGGGGSGSTNNCTGTPANGAASSGAAGGGIVFVRAGTTSGAGNVNVQGASANGTIANDASGGGGAGGSALVFVNNNGGATGATINASGGNGGSNSGSGAPHGPGGGGSGGYVVLSGSAAFNVAGGNNGTTAASPTSTIDYGSTASSGGVQYVGLTANQIPGAGASPVCYPRITVTKSTTTPGVVQGGTANYRITATNAAGFGTAQVVRLTDVLPANPNFTFAATNSITLGGGATRPAVTNPAAAATTPVWGDFTLPGGGSVVVDFSVNVLAATPVATYQNPATVDYLDPTRSVAATRVGPGSTYTAGGVVPGSNYNSASSTNEDVTVRAAAAIAKAFNPTSIADGGVTTLTITLTNPNAVPLTNAAFTDNYPTGLENAATPAGATTCAGGAVTAVASASTLALAGATIPASGSCTVTVNVTATIAQTYVNTLPAGALTDTENVSSAASTGGTLLGRPRVVKSFSPIAVPQNTDSTLSIAITNPNASQALTLSNPALSDNFPAGMVATGGTVTYTGAGCAGMAPTVISAGAASFSITAGTLGAGGTCTASFAVRSATIGSYPNTTTGVITTQTPNAGNASNTANLGVGVINISKAFGTTAPFAVPGRIRQGQNNTITFTLVNPTGVAQTNGSFTDSLANMSIALAAVGGTCTGTTPSSLVVGATSLAFTGINVPAGSCTITVTVTSNTVGAQNNTTSGVTTALLPQGPPSNTDTLYVFGPSTITKTFSPAAIGPGTTSTMILTIANPNALPLTGLTFTDTYPVAPAPLVNATPLVVGGTCTGVTTTATAGGGTFNVSVGNLPAGASCTITSAVTSNTPGTYTNSTSGVSTTEAAPGAASNAAQLVVLAPATIAKAFSPATIGAGGTTTVTFTLANPNATTLTNARFTDTFNGMSVASSTIGGTCVGTFGSPPPASGDTFVDLRVPSLAAGASCTVTLTVTSATTGVQSNTSSGITTTETPTAGAASNTATLTVVATPTIAKSFAPGTIQAGGTSVLTFTLSNPNASTTLTTVAFSDTLVNMTLANATVGGTCAGVTFAPALSAGGTQVNPSVASLAGGASCTVTVNVTSSVVSSATGHPNTTSGATSAQTPTAGATSTAFLAVRGSPTIAKSFVPSAITVGGVSTMVFTITNPNPVPLTAGTFTDTFPANLAINNVNQNFIGAGRGTCTTAIPSAMTAGAAPATNPFPMSNVTVPANGSCTIMVDVTSAVAGNYNNTTTGMSTTQTPTAGPASNTATLRVLSQATLTKAFVTNPILVNGTTVMRFTVANPNPTAALTNIAFTDTLSNMTVSNATAGGTCTGVTFAPALTVGGTQVNPAVATLAAASSCTIDITVQSTVGSIATGHPNTTSGPTSFEVPTAGTAASAALYVVSPPAFTKAFTTPSVPVGTGSSTVFLVSNTSPFALSAVGFTDIFPTAPGAMTASGVASTNTPCGGTLRDQAAGTISAGDTQAVFAGGAVAANGSCTFNFPLRGAAAGVYTNTTTTLAWTATTPAGTIAGTSPAASDVLTVGQTTVTKAFGAPTIVQNTGTTTLAITVSNNTGGALVGVAFNDPLPAGMSVVNPPVATNTCIASTLTSGGANGNTSVAITGGTLANGLTCVVTVTVKGATAGVLSNTVTGSAPAALNGKSDTQTITVMAPPTVAKSFSQAVFTTGDTPTLSITLTNPNPVAITGVVATDTFPTAPGAMTVATPLTTTNTCGGTLQNSTGGVLAVGSPGIRLNAGTIPANGSCSFSVNITAATAGAYTNTIAAAGVTTTNSGSNAASASAGITFAITTLSKAFAPTSIAVGGTSTLSFTLAKAAAAATQSGIGFTDTLPPGLVVAGTPNVQTNCPTGGAFAAPGFAVTAAAGSGSIAVSGASINNAVATCVVRVAVTTSAAPTIAPCPAAGNINGAANVSALANIDNGVTNQCLQVAAAVPALTKAFSPATINTGDTTTLTFTVTQPAGNGTQAFSFNDTLPAGLVIGAGAVGGTCTLGSVTATAGTSTIAVAGRQISASSCTITVPVTTAATPTVGACPGTPANTNDATAISGTSNVTNAVTSQCLAVAAAPPALTKSFSPASIPQGGISTITFTIANGAGNPAQSGVGFTDNLPANVVVAGVPNASTTCGAGSLTATAGATSVALAGGTLTAGQASCIVRVDVTSATAGAYTNDSTRIAGVTGGLITAGVNASLTVYASAALTKAFNPLAIGPGAISTLTFTMTNGAGNPVQAALAFNDALAANLVIAAVPNVRTSCPAGGALGGIPGGMTVTATAGGGSISVSGAAINSGVTSCQVTVDVTSSTPGGYPNTSANISGLNGGLTAGAVSSTLTVAGATLAKAFAPATIGVGATSQLTFTVTNGGGNPAQNGLAFLDALPSGLVVATPNGLANTCGGAVTAAAGSTSVQLAGGTLSSGTGSCTIQVNVTAAAAGNYNNASGNVSGASTNLNAGAVSASLAVVQPTLTKAFAPASVAVGGTTTLTFTLTNGSGNPAQGGINFTDTLQAGIRIAAVPALATTCPSGTAVMTAVAGSGVITVTGATMSAAQASCTISVDVTPAPAPTVSACPAANNTNGSGDIGSTARVTNGVTPQCLAVTAATPALDKAFSAALTVGGSTTLTFTVSQPTGNPTQTFSFTDTLPAGLVVGAGAVGGTCSGGSVTAAAGSGTITVAGRQVVNPATSCTLTVPITSAAAPTVSTCPAPNNTNGTASISATTNIVAAVSNSAAGGGSSTTGACVTVNAATPTMDKAFSAGLTVGGSTTLTFTLSQPTGNPTQTFSFTDTLPAGLVVGAGAVGGTCTGGSVTAVAGAGTITVAGRQVVNPATSCTITVPITTAAAPTVGVCPAASNTNGTASISATTNVTASISNSAAGGGTSTTGACVAVTAAVPSLTKAFSAGLAVGGTTTLTFTATQPAGNPTQAFSFTDTLPAGLVVGSGAVGGTCTGGSVTATAGTTAITVAGRQLVNPATSCTITVPVTTAAAPSVATCPTASNTNGNANVSATTNIAAAIANSAAGGGTSTTGACVSVSAAVPTLDKAFSGALTVGGSTTLTFTVSQPAGNPAQLVSFTDTLPAGLVVGAGATGGTCTGGSIVASAGASTITVTTKQVSGASCTITAPIAAAAAPTAGSCPVASNTNGTASISATTNLTAAISNSAAGGGTSTTGACVSVNAAVPTLDKAFSAGLTVGGMSTLTFTLSQPANNPTQAVSFTDTLPAGLVVGAGAVGGTCAGGSVTAAAGSGTITVASRQVAGASCTITVPVTTAAAPTIGVCPAANNTNGTASISATSNVTAAVSNSAAGGGTSTTGACVTVTAATPALDKAFSAGLTVGGTSTLTFTVSQPTGNPTSTFSFTDTLPAGLVVGAGAVGGTCSGGSVTAVAGSSTITVASRQVVSPATSCTITVPVTTAAAPTVATCPAANNTNGTASISSTTNLTAAVSNSAAGGGTSTTGACVTVGAAVPSLNKAFSAGLTVGGATTLTFTVSQPAGNPTQAFSFTDTLPAGLVVGAGAVGGTCSGGSVTATAGSGTITVASRQVTGASCTITVPITSAAAPTVGVCPAASNTNGTASISATTNVTAAVANSAAGGGTSTTGACVTVTAATPTLDKTFSAGLTVGGTTTLTFTLSQPAGNPAQAVSFVDTLPAGLVVGAGALGGTCAGGSVTATAGSGTITVAGRQVSGAACTITVPIATAAAPTVAACPAANNTNGTANISATTNVTAAISDSAAGGGTSTTGACVTVSAATPTVDKAFSGALTVGGATTLTFTVTQAAGNPTSTFSFIDTLPAGLVVGAGAVGGTCSGGSVTATAGTATINVASRQLVNPATSCTITVPVSTSATPTVATCPAANNTNGAAQFSGTANISAGISNSAAGGGTSTTGACVTVGAATPVLTKGMSPGSIAIGGTTTLTFTVTQPTGNPTQAFSFTDTLPAGLVIGAGAVGGTCAGGSVTATAGTSAITVAGRQIANPATTCTITVPVTTSGTPDTSACPVAANTNGAAQISATTNLANGVTNQCVTVFAPPTATKSFTPATIGVGQASALRLVLTNPAANSAALTTLLLADPIGSFGLSVAAPASATFTPAACGTLQSRAIAGSGGFGALTAGHFEIQLAVASLAPGVSCQVDVNVTSTTPGVATNVTAAPTASGPVALAGSTASASITVRQATLAKSFAPTAIDVNGVATLTFTLDNGAGNPAQGGINFTDTLPAGVVVAATPNLATTCPSGTGVVTAAAAATAITVTGASMSAAQASCSISVDVTSASAGTYLNTAGNFSAVQRIDASGASATLTVSALPALTKAFAAANVGIGQVTTLTFQVANTGTNALARAGISFTDTLPAGLAIANPAAPTSSNCGAPTFTAVDATQPFTAASISVASGATCSVTLNVRGTALGAKTNNAASITAISGATNGVTPQGLTVVQASLDKAFAPTTINVNGTSTLTFTLTNGAGNPAEAGIAFTDALPGSVRVAATPNVATNCPAGGGFAAPAFTVTAAAGSASVAVAAATMNAAVASCQVRVDVTAAIGGVYTNDSSRISGTANVTNAVNASTLTVNAGPPSLTKAFGTSPVNVATPSTLTITLSNPNSAAAALTVALTDTLPAPLVVAPTPNAATTCPGAGAVTATAGTNTITLPGTRSIPAAVGVTPGTCTITVDVVSPFGGSFTNTIPAGALQTSAGNNAAPASATLAVNAAAPAIAKAFAPATIAADGTSTITFTITNPNAFALTSGSFTDTLAQMGLVAPLTAGGTCAGAGGNTYANGQSGLITVSGLTLPAASGASAGSCTVTLAVTSDFPGPHNNQASGVTATGAPAGAASNVATLTVTAAPATIAKAFSPASIPVGATSTLTFTLGNTNGVALTGAQFTDTLANMSIAGAQSAAGTCAGAASNAFAAAQTALGFSGISIPANGTCTVTVTVTSSTVGAQNNTSSGVLTNEAATGAASNTATLTVTATAPTITKSFTPATINSGQVATLQVTITNPNASAISVASLTDSFPATPGAGLARATTPNASAGASCGAGTVSSTAASVTLSNATIAAGGSCSFQIDVTAATSGSYVNTVPIGSLNSSAGSNTAAAAATLTVNPVANVGVTKLAPSTIGTGAVLTYTIAVTNAGPDAAPGTTFSDTVPAQLSGVTASCTGAGGGAACGTVNVVGNTVTTTIPTLPSGGNVSLTISGTAQGVGLITNTASVAGPGGVTDPVAANDTSSASTTILAPDLTISKAHAGNFTVGSNGTYTIAVTNQPGSLSTSGPITVTDTLPAGLGFVSATGTGWACGFGSGTVTCIMAGSLAAGQVSNPIALVVSVASIAAPSVTNFATVSGGGEPAATTGNNTASDNTIVGGAAVNAFAPNNAQTGMPGTVVFYPHTFNAGLAGSVQFTTGAITTPAAPAWSQIVYRDANCNGTLDGAEGVAPLTTAVAVNPGDQVCIIVKDSIPANAPYNATNNITITATFNGAQAYTRTDLTTVGAAGGAGLTLAKTVRNVTQGGAAGTTGSARPNDVLEYTITYTNAGSGPLSAIVITDATPSFTSYLSAACAALPASLTACTVSSAPAIGAVGSVVWTLSGTLLSNGSGFVTYQVRVSP